MKKVIRGNDTKTSDSLVKHILAVDSLMLMKDEELAENECHGELILYVGWYEHKQP
jgi:predicted hydrolase (HD superfamily)